MGESASPKNGGPADPRQEILELVETCGFALGRYAALRRALLAAFPKVREKCQIGQEWKSQLVRAEPRPSDVGAAPARFRHEVAGAQLQFKEGTVEGSAVLTFPEH